MGTERQLLRGNTGTERQILRGNTGAERQLWRGNTGSERTIKSQRKYRTLRKAIMFIYSEKKF